MKYKIALVLLVIIYCADNHIIQRAAEDYYPLAEDCWWRYSNGTDSVYVETEPMDTLLQVACFPVSYNGNTKYLAKSDESISQYITRIHNYGGLDYTVLEDFIVRIELPLVKGNVYHHILSDSIYVANQVITAQHEVIGTVVDFVSESNYGDVYQLEIVTIESMITGDTSITDTTVVIEFYAPAVGMVRFSDATGEYELTDYNIP
jgi:hypothetical protein